MTATLADVITLPGAADIVTTEPRSIAGRVYEIKMLARNPGPLTQFAIMTVLEKVCHPSLQGEALWEAWKAAEDAILILDVAGADMDDYEHWKDRADLTIGTLIHGHGYHGGRAA